MFESNQFYHKYFSLTLKRYMFCIMCEISEENFNALFKGTLNALSKYIKTKHDAYTYCNQYEIKGFETCYMLQNTVTFKDLISLTEKSFFYSDKELNKYYSAFVYNNNPPLSDIAFISWSEILSCLWKWNRLTKNEKKIFQF